MNRKHFELSMTTEIDDKHSRSLVKELNVCVSSRM